jgi:hypothetical protein
MAITSSVGRAGHEADGDCGDLIDWCYSIHPPTRIPDTRCQIPDIRFTHKPLDKVKGEFHDFAASGIRHPASGIQGALQ